MAEPPPGAAEADAVLARYPGSLTAATATYLGGAGGFSGARFWRVGSTGESLCLRRWPREHPDAEHLTAIHQVLCHVHSQGLDLVPQPLPTCAGESFVSHAGHLWELTRWMPGQANFREHPGDKRLAAAMQALARFHVAAHSAPVAQPHSGPSPGLQQRLQRVQALRAGQCDLLARAITPAVWPNLFESARQCVQLFRAISATTEDALAPVADRAVPLQMCIRDVWHDHVLFKGDRVSGIIDFGTMRTEHVAGDVARLLGSLVGDDPRRREVGLAAYGQVRPLSQEELRLVTVFDASSVALSPLNWIEWIYVDGRRFEQPSTIEARFDELLSRLARLAAGDGISR